MLPIGFSRSSSCKGTSAMAASGSETPPGGDDSDYKSGVSEKAASSNSETEPTGTAAAEDRAAAPGDATDKANAAGEAAVSDKPGTEGTSPPELHAHHVSKILDEVLEEPVPAAGPRRFKHPMILDLILAMSLLIAMGGFTIGLFKMYLTHSAEQSITQQNYKAAIAILKGAPLPGFFTIPGSDPEELLAQALYLDAMDKLENDDVDGALKELQQIKAGSRYFELAQELILENYEPSPTLLQGGAEHVETNPEPLPEKKPILPELPPDGSR